MFFLTATLVGWIGGDFVYIKVGAKNTFPSADGAEFQEKNLK